MQLSECYNLNQPRYLMSVEIDGGENSISYDELLKELEEYANV